MRLGHVETLCYNEQHKLQFFHTNSLCIYNSFKKPIIIANNCAFQLLQINIWL